MKQSQMNFHESVDYLLSLGNEVSTMKLGLESMRRLLAALGNPHEKFLKVQVAGTNGKGSVCAFLNSICLRAGVSTGMYTSPHLVAITERIHIDGHEISEREFARLATRVRETAEELAKSGELEGMPTFFEQVTAIALAAFAEANVELAILETGLGGRLDATTAAKAEIAAITRIDLDHQKYLGNSLAEIAAEKAAIIREGSKAVVLRQERTVEQVIAGRCREVGVDPIWAKANIRLKPEPIVLPRLIATFTTERAGYGNVLLWDMLGEHQLENAALAICIAEVLGDSGLTLDSQAIVLGLETAEHPGRLEFVDRFLLDGAHNVGGAKALRSFLDKFIQQPITMLFGSMAEKDVKDIASILFPLAEKLILTRPDNSRALGPDDLLKIVPVGFDREQVFMTENARAAIAKALEVSGTDNLIVVTGSLYLVGEVKRVLSCLKS